MTIREAIDKLDEVIIGTPTLTIHITPAALIDLAADLGQPIETLLFGSRLAVDQITYRTARATYMLSAGYRKATPDELRREATRMNAEAEASDVDA